MIDHDMRSDDLSNLVVAFYLLGLATFFVSQDVADILFWIMRGIVGLGATLAVRAKVRRPRLVIGAGGRRAI